MRYKRIHVLIWTALVFSVSHASVQDWTWSFAKIFSAKERERNEFRECILFSKVDVPEFSQLIFSWNAFRPEQGYYSFLVQVRDARSKEWGAWHKMIDWGAQVQRSYTSKSDGRTQYFHVRLETGSQRYADGFRVKLEKHAGASLRGVHRLSVNISNFTKFSSEVTDEQLRLLPSVLIPNVPRKSQMALDHPRSHEMCSPTSSSIITSYLCDCHVDPIDFAKNAFDNGLNAYGSWPFNTAHAFERCNGAVYFATMRCNSFATLHSYLQRGVPVVVSVRGVLVGAPKAYPKGHLLVVIGWDAKKQEVICHDPAFQADELTCARYALATFLAAWERSHRLAYVAEQSFL